VRRVLIAAFGVALLVLGAAGLAVAKPRPSTTTTSTTPPALDPRVFIVGDSVMLGAQQAIGFRLGVTGWLVAQHEAESLHTWEVPAIIAGARNAGGVAEVVVVEMGANDGSDPAQFAGWIDGVMASAQDVDRVYWVNMRQFRTWVPAANAEINAAAGRWANMRVVDWGARSQNEPGFVGDDGLHLTDAGKAALADLVAQDLDAYRAERTPPTTVPPPPTEVASAHTARASDVPISLWVAGGVAGLVALGAGVTKLARRRSHTA